MDADEFMRMMEGLPLKRKTEVHEAPSVTATVPKEVVETKTAEKPVPTVPANNCRKEVPSSKKRNDSSSYKDKYLRPLEKNDEEQNARICICIPDRLHTTLKRLCNLVFDGKVSMTAFVTNVLNDHIENHRELYDSIYQPKSWNA